MRLGQWRTRFLEKFQVPREIWGEFLEESVKKNNHSFGIICAIVFAAEVFNILRVLVFSRSGLSTVNNRIYFSLYCVLLLMAAVWLALRKWLGKLPVGRQWAAQYVLTALLFFWHMGLNAYDLYRNTGTGVTILTTALLAMPLFIQMAPRYSAPLYVVFYLGFWCLLAPQLELGDWVNLTIAFAVSLAVSLVEAHHSVVNLQWKKRAEEVNAKLQELVRQDSLTGLWNKVMLERQVERTLQEVGRPGGPGAVTLFLMDLDRFKEVNDRYGHPCGDHVLLEAAECMRSVFEGAAIGRVGGDEFAAAYDKALPADQAEALARRFNGALHGVRWQDAPMGMSCSVGVCVCQAPGWSYQRLYTQADKMLYQAKKTRNGQCRIESVPGQP